MSNIKLSLTAIATALGLAIALQSGTAMAQSVSQAVPADALKGTQFADADYIRHSWGLEYVPFDAPPVQYTWAEIRARLAEANAVKTVAQSDTRPVPAEALRGTQFDSPDYVRHSWGLEQVPFDAPPVQYTWSEVNARLNAATVKTGSAAPRADLQPIPANALRGTQFDGPEYVRHDWGLEYVPFDAPSVRLNWGEIKQRLG
jgi:hypothetical protein